MALTNSPSENGCPLQRDPDRKNVCQKNGGFWWSADLNCWIVSEPTAIGKILRDRHFCVHSYKFSEVASRLGIGFPHHEALRNCLPLALEGEKHTSLRRRFSEEIAANSVRALEIFESELVAMMRLHFSAGKLSRFCVVKEVIRPSIKSANLAIAGLQECKVANLESLPLFFDESISLRGRQTIERLIGELYAKLPKTMSDDEKYFRIAMLALSVDTLFGSISESFLTVVRRNPEIALSGMDWDHDLPATALPMIERKALAETWLFGHWIKAGDRVRLFLDVEEFDRDTGSKYTELYFAAGPHRCPGINYSRKIWNIFVRHLRQIEVKLHIRALAYRSNDKIFTLLDMLEIESYV
jgi:hypothetical protein